jgi:hypothetical protein
MKRARAFVPGSFVARSFAPGSLAPSVPGRVAAWVALAIVGVAPVAGAQSLTISGPTTATVGEQIVLDIVGDPTGGSADILAYARVSWDPALAVAVSYTPTPETTSFVLGGTGIGPGRANAVNAINVAAELPGQPLGGQLTLDLVAPGTLVLSFDAPPPLDEPRFFGLAPGQAGSWELDVGTSQVPSLGGLGPAALVASLMVLGLVALQRARQR